jgi:nitrogen fixation/metabolism regulation signal transduction histidine kinase
MRFRNRVKLLQAVLGGVALLVVLCGVGLILLAPDTTTRRWPLLLTVFFLALVLGLLGINLLLRRLLRPYSQLVGEAERAPVAAGSVKARDEAEFVLETFQSVVAQLQAQQRELETLTAQASARAVSAEKFSERIVASVPSGLLAFDARGVATVVNAPARALIEADDGATDKPVGELLRHVPELALMVERCLRTGEVNQRVEVAYIGEAGRTRRLGATVAPIDPTPERGARGALCLLTDITEVTQLREQVALKRNLESLGEMSAGLAHEFKNALATLHGYAQLMQSLNQEAQGRAAADALLHEVRGLSAMVTSFLNFARPQPLELAPVSLAELLDESAKELQNVFNERRATLNITGDFPEVRADETMLRQALLNLIRNAAEAIDEDSPARRVEVRGQLERDENGIDVAVVEIEDTGSGIPAEDLSRIFIPFFTTKSKGHGVGLALAHRVVTSHEGTLSAANSQTGGAIFTLKLPL